MSVELKIKSKHLSEEARIIRFEENKFLNSYRWDIKVHQKNGHNSPLLPSDNENYRQFKSLSEHRKWDVRNENRATFLARAYLAGIPYNRVEQKRKEENEYTFRVHVLPRVASMVAKYGDKKIAKEVWEGSFTNRKKVKNVEFTKLLQDLRKWSEL